MQPPLPPQKKFCRLLMAHRLPVCNLWSQQRDSVLAAPEEIQKMTRSHPSSSPRPGSGERVKLCSSLFFHFSRLLLKVQNAPTLPPGCSHLLPQHQLTAHPPEAASEPPLVSPPLSLPYSRRSPSALCKVGTNFTCRTPSRCPVGAMMDTEQIIKPCCFTETMHEALAQVRVFPFNPPGNTYFGKMGPFLEPTMFISTTE